MSHLRWFYTSFSLILLLPLTAAAEKLLLSFTVRDGDEVTLPCENVIDDWWKGAKSKSDRLSVTVNCSLVIKKVTVEDVGRYFCQQYKSEQKQGEGSQVYLSVINKGRDNWVTLSCSVLSYDPV
ncbi:hypothetical protein L3Q82_011373 [Scortum barcoo]|uniref:Uncharacterized protein n=1 Tax=Scortum barcoo TaxID=214431 RepID=A0ACB8W9T7_9TELE|nr:hypothetical protein L3Q82_011373 [Scortum barcoo]